MTPLGGMHMQARIQAKKVTDFSGKPSEDVEEWTEHFRLVRRANGWDNAYCMSMLPACLHGAALQWWKREGEPAHDEFVRQSFQYGGGTSAEELNEVLGALIKRFIDPAKEENARILIKSRGQRRGETVREYMSALDTLFMRADIATNGEMQRYFEDGLRPEIKQEVLRAGPKNLQAAYNLACRQETVQARMATPVPRLSTIARITANQEANDDEGDAKRVGAVTLSRDEKGDDADRGGRRGGFGRRSDRQGGRRDITCHNCGKPGHMAKDCYSKPKGPGGNGGRGRQESGMGRGGGGRGRGERKCFLCQETTHILRDCPENPRRSTPSSQHSILPLPSNPMLSSHLPASSTTSVPRSSEPVQSRQNRGVRTVGRAATKDVSDSAKEESDEKLPGYSYIVEGEICGLEMNDILLDSGAMVSILPGTTYLRMSTLHRPALGPRPRDRVDGVNGGALDIVGMVDVRVVLGGVDCGEMRMAVVENMKHPQVILGLDWIDSVVSNLCTQTKMMAVMRGGVVIGRVPFKKVEGNGTTITVGRIITSKQQCIPPLAEKLMDVYIDTRNMEKGNAYVERSDVFEGSTAVHIQDGVVKIQGGMKQERVSVSVFNTSLEPVKLASGAVIGEAESVEVASQSLDPATLIRSLQRRGDEWVWEGTVMQMEEEEFIEVDDVESDYHFPPAPPLNSLPGDTRTSSPWDGVYLDPTLDEQQAHQMCDLLNAYLDVAVRNASSPLPTPMVVHDINTGQGRPIKQYAGRRSEAQHAIIENEVKNMLRDGIIEPARSEWSSRVLLVRKKNGRWRFCVDYRDLNLETVKDVYNLPRMDDILERMGKAAIFTKMDLAAGYWQVLVHPKDRAKTAFTTREGLFQFIRMPFGLCNAPATFQRMMNAVLSDLIGKCVFVYIDDIIVYSQDFKTHMQHVRMVLDRLRGAGLQVIPSKCDIACSWVEFLGHIISGEGIKVDPKKIAAMVNFPRPTSVTTLRSFLGLVTYYHKFIDHFAERVAILYTLTSKKEGWLWTDECEMAFSDIKDAMTCAPVLRMPNLSQPFIIQTDASDIGLGAVLSQRSEDGKEEWVIAYASRVLRKAEKNYTTTEKECLAIVWESVSSVLTYGELCSTSKQIIVHYPGYIGCESQRVACRDGYWHYKSIHSQSSIDQGNRIRMQMR